ncbi:UDP-4-amino-4,6-dideoxy-N-acetyl-beta-L-altrosamine transaminase [Gracilibacillus dipsosauri]|uniref:UDP-4-amino-4, 6-dideoxy-N-acetyl-beta-L-altrosamine transaminase n=1 Tax=Gracilibacillus dipsosauri TaxID=178340 RepID=UPI002409C92B
MRKKEQLAIYGGKPVRDAYLPYGSQWIEDEDIQAVSNVLRSDYLTTGPIIKAFEESVADYVGAKYAVAFSSGTAALHAACYAANIDEGDEVITTPMTFAATSNAILYLDGKPVFADIDPLTYTISPERIEPLITEKTKAIITVDYTGQPANYDQIQQLAKKHKLLVIDDAAHALGATYKGKRIGSIADMTMFSFHPVKHITTGEGGMITTNQKSLYDKLKSFRTHGITRDPNRWLYHDHPWYYEMQDLGFNYRMTDFQAALGLSQLKKSDKFLRTRRTYAKQYTEQFKDLNAIITPFQHEDGHSSWHLYMIRLKSNKIKADRLLFFQALQKENIGVNVHYIPVYWHPYYQQLGYKKGICPVAENLYEEIITLPLYPKMSEQDIQDVIAAVKKVHAYFSTD